MTGLTTPSVLAVTRGALVAAAMAATTAAWAALAGAALFTPHRHGVAAPAVAAAVVMWFAMVVAMMTPTVVPWVTAYGRMVAGPDGTPAWRAIGAFSAGYFVVWLAYSVVAAALQFVLAQAGVLVGGRVSAVAGALVLIAAGAFQFLPVKASCLTHCRNPLSYFVARWHDGPIGGLRLGLSHGAYCLGCCWLLMLTAFAMGVMNLAWMATLTVLVAVEQLTPAGALVSRVSGGLLVAWGVWLLW